MFKNIMIDTHTHTVLSGHAWSTLRENAAAAARRGIKGLCLTEHGPDMPGAGPNFIPSAQRMLPEFIEGIRVYKGIEADISDYDGKLDIDDRMLLGTEWCIASLHDLTIRAGTEEKNTNAMIGALHNPIVDILAHIDDRKMPVIFAEVVKAAGKLNKLIEINNNSLLIRKGSRERLTEVAELCKKHNVRVAVSSDAHFDSMVGQVDLALELLAGLDFPEELVINRQVATFEAYLRERKDRLPGKQESFRHIPISRVTG